MFVVTLPARAAGEPVVFARRAKAAGAQLLEIRGDLTPGLAPFASPLPLLVAPRGGPAPGVPADWVSRLTPAFVDLELGEPEAHAGGCTGSGTGSGTGPARIRSFHDHRGTPDLDALRAIVDRLERAGGDLLKLATRVNGREDLLALERLQVELWRREQLRGRTVVLGMGPLARRNRLRSPWRNALTYACLDGEPASAPGQVSLRTYARLARRARVST